MAQTHFITSADDLVAYYGSINPTGELLIGIELERSGIYRDSLEPVSHAGEKGYQAVFRKLIEEAGWQISQEEDGNIYELVRGEARVTIEGNGRPELAGSPRANLHELAREFRLHDNELREIGNIFNIAWVPMGLEPLHNNEAFSIVPKKRYQIFMEIDRSPATDTLMRRCNGVHVNFSYTDGENCIAKVQTAFRILPITSAMYACSPFDAGKLSDTLDLRRAIMSTQARCGYGVPKNILDERFDLHDWMDFYLDGPVVLMKQADGTDVLPKKPLTFRTWMTEGYEGRFPGTKDFDQHVKTFWTDIRLRQGYIEYRPCDTVPAKVAMSLPAFVKGIVFDSENWEAVRKLTEDWTYDDIIDADRRAWKTGLRTEVKGKTLLTYARELLTLSNEKLHMFERAEGGEDDESVHIAPLKEQIYIKEKNFAEELSALWKGEWNENSARILEWCERE